MHKRMDITGNQLIASETPEEESTATNRPEIGAVSFRSINPATGESFGEMFYEATDAEVDRALTLAGEAFASFRVTSAEVRARLLESIADRIMAVGDPLLERAHAETGLPMGRLEGERARAVNQTRLFARMVGEGSWVNARIDRGDPGRKPMPKPDVRSMLTGIGPVIVFGASNFPLAISVAGTDTISALGAGCPVVVKAHPGHPGTSELLGRAIQQAVREQDLPAGCFSMVQGKGHDVGLALVRHPKAKAVAFTGSLRGGRALFDAAAARHEPIPVYAEMGSTNPVFLLPGALEQRAKDIAQGYVQSVNLGVGQFCTNPGIVLGAEGDGLNRFVEEIRTLAGDVEPATMLHEGIYRGYEDGVRRIAETAGVRPINEGNANGAGPNKARCMLFLTDADVLHRTPRLAEEEVFGPASIVTACPTIGDMERVARSLDGHLTATVHGTEEDLRTHASLLRILETRVGRLIFNGFPTGIEVCAAMHHGGPYPATTDSHYTSIGTAAILRFGRPICYQNFPDASLPPPLRNKNESGLWRMIDNELTRDDVA